MSLPAILFFVSLSFYLIFQFLRELRVNRELDVLGNALKELISHVKDLTHEVDTIIMEMNPPNDDDLPGGKHRWN